jgi:hypothetical protein
MAISFEESRKRLVEQSQMAVFSMRNIEKTGSDWTKHDEYTWFDDYYDDNFSTIDGSKNISAHISQINISQEVNSQFIPFEMPRRYDNIDMVGMAISIHYTTSDKRHNSSKPVNVQYNDEKIRFTWLVDENVTYVSGDVNFEIHINGAIVDSNGNAYAYRWKTKPAKFTVSKSLCEGLDCEPADMTDDWVEELVESVTTSVAENFVESIADSEVNEYVQNTVDDALTWGMIGSQNR